MDKIIEELIDFKKARGWGKHHTEGELARALMIEVAELNELLLWGKKAPQERYEEEIADVLIYAINFCIIRKIDPMKAIKEKIEKNAIKYPVDVDNERKYGWRV
jgi:NTP pyrophosphatase (non-canonical NTP hydrolase)